MGDIVYFTWLGKNNVSGYVGIFDRLGLLHRVSGQSKKIHIVVTLNHTLQMEV